MENINETTTDCAETILVECEDCNGKGRVKSYTCGDGCCTYFDTCDTCDGFGEIEETKNEETAK